ncbi:DUF2383 domain-containing protein [Priestia filamentosa]|uniref:DUF2383 domain-containing protein n=1 Tax=Priestia filamentosa TaxID=1402861 RepID=UPI001FB34DD1|nr:DUF2383 domain-containing protein [Priestia filamentosa]MED3728812.1 DUF2383 domain-containing protein [Priestia filamentosa]UOE58484.1 DUF2383 domain-containing protein [Priestia filamentosa]
MDKKQIVDTLNKLVEGQYMGIHAYENFIKNLDSSSSLLSHFIEIRKDLEHHAELLSKRVQILDGTPKSSEGIIGKIELFISQLFDSSTSEQDILKHAIKGQNLYGIKMTEELVSNKLDEERLCLVHEILQKQREHVDYLKYELHSRTSSQ